MLLSRGSFLLVFKKFAGFFVDACRGDILIATPITLDGMELACMYVPWKYPPNERISLEKRANHI